MCYVDDPLAALAGTVEDIKIMATMMILTWEALGFKLAYAKGQFGEEVTWIGGAISCSPGRIKVIVKEAIVSDIKDDLRKFLGCNVISLKELHSTTGKLNHAAGLLIIRRPFMEPLWVAIHAADKAKGPPNRVWTKKVKPTLHWFQAFFGNEGDRLCRIFTLEAYQRTGAQVEIGTDASPWGLGGWIAIDGKITEYVSSQITQQDVVKFGHEIGSADGQQIWECLAILVAIDSWHAKWAQQRVVLKIKGDNVAALTLLVKMRPSGPTMAIIARELALRLAVLSFPPDAVHTPGVAHVLADRLSRVHCPDGPGRASADLHPAIADATEASVPERTKAWCKADPGSSADETAGEDKWESWVGYD